MKSIEVKNLIKTYFVDKALQQKTFRELLFSFFQSTQKYKKHALNNISFHVEKGEVLGVVGKNGSGKSTLLKILSKIVTPSSGSATVYGKVASLLEVGTGFHGDLTGKENIYLSGIILGMTRAQIKKSFQEIVSFAGVEEFLNTPVKRYSSGMRLRLAFSIAAHLDPEILLVDEVLAVGDYEFEKKCLKRIDSLGSLGTTIVVVSHNLSSIRRLCSRVLVLEKGKIIFQGHPEEAIKKYLTCSTKEKEQKSYVLYDSLRGVRVEAVEVGEKLKKETVFNASHAIELKIKAFLEKDITASFMLWFYNKQGHLLFVTTDSSDGGYSFKKRKAGYYTSTCTVPPYLFTTGKITIDLYVVDSQRRWFLKEQEVSDFFVYADDADKKITGDWTSKWPHVMVRPFCHWNIEYKGIGNEAKKQKREQSTF